MAKFSTNVSFADFDTESVVIDRASSGSARTYSTIYAGACDFQSTGGSQYTNPAGAVDIADADLFISPIAGALPAVKVGDRATVTQSGATTTYNVVNTAVYTFPIQYLELALKRGPIDARPGARR